MEDYILEVKTVSKRDSTQILFGDKECLMAKEGSTFVIKLSNAGTTACDVKLAVDGSLLHTWRVRSQESITIRKHHQTQQELRFPRIHEHVSTKEWEADVCHECVVSAHFYPARDDSFLEEVSNQHCAANETCSIPDRHIHWGKCVILTVPVILCDHHLQ
jgi:hypothetical protein